MAWVILLVALLLPVPGWAALAVDVHGKGTVAVASSQTESVTVGASATGLWVLQIWQGTQTTSGCTWNGGAMTQIGSTVTSGAGLNLKVALFQKLSPTTSTHDVVCSWSGATSGSNLYWISVTGGDTSTGSRTVATQTDGTTGPGLTLGDFAAGDIAIHGVHLFGNTITFDAGETAQQSDNYGSSGNSAGLSYKTASGTVGTTDSVAYAEIAVALIPASSTPDTTPFYKRRIQ